MSESTVEFLERMKMYLSEDNYDFITYDDIQHLVTLAQEGDIAAALTVEIQEARIKELEAGEDKREEILSAMRDSIGDTILTQANINVQLRERIKELEAALSAPREIKGLRVIDTQTGQEAKLSAVYMEPWCCFDKNPVGFVFSRIGNLFILDDYGGIHGCPEGRFRVEAIE